MIRFSGVLTVIFGSTPVAMQYLAVYGTEGLEPATAIAKAQLISAFALSLVAFSRMSVLIESGAVVGSNIAFLINFACIQFSLLPMYILIEMPEILELDESHGSAAFFYLVAAINFIIVERYTRVELGRIKPIEDRSYLRATRTTATPALLSFFATALLWLFSGYDSSIPNHITVFVFFFTVSSQLRASLFQTLGKD